MTELFGKKLKALRTSKKISQKEFGKLFGVAESTIGMYERDERRPDFELLNKFADYFKVSTDYLLGRTDTKESTTKDDEAEFQAFINDPELQVWYRELPKSDEEELRKLRMIWEMIKNEKK
ncbi:helix-turn-helix domain-containing protein [Lysinibacillus halotolerans]|uniref:XRE family transcriptional regulator n=1 Tax=Lysinibacillus halotolerans TaxID=1368476 RepID=A0A3M8H791_9BACI|nr:helix-turn-helix transcriptional regulator [Lysinibacillus halotolerans]RNC98263.1 XRE family transcriptional regulator [Lysinibacillus halotolerans]